MNLFRTYLNDFLELFYPQLCLVCGNNLLKQEELVCLDCLHHLPRTNYHLTDDNPVAQIFYGRVRLEAATAFFFFSKGSKYQKLLHHLKYKGLKEVGTIMGRHFATDINQSPLFATVDIICPVPLHPKKEKKRGYNQSDFIAKGIAEGMNKQLVTDNLIRVVHTDSQTRKGRYERWENVEGIFELSRPEEFAGKHILLVDDVVTTGSTLEACAIAILAADNARVSVATLGCA